jgi:uncharacterized membrane protein (DUF485 family)
LDVAHLPRRRQSYIRADPQKVLMERVRREGDLEMTDESELHRLVRRRWLIVAALSLAVVVIYFGFILLIAFNPQFMGQIIADGLSVGILLGALVILSSWLLTYVYVRWANAHFDAAVSRLNGSKQQ